MPTLVCLGNCPSKDAAYRGHSYADLTSLLRQQLLHKPGLCRLSPSENAAPKLKPYNYSLYYFEFSYLTKELASRPTRPMAAPPTAVTLQPRMSVKTLTMGEQKKIIPMEREPTHAAGDRRKRT